MLQHGHSRETTPWMRMPQNEIKSKIVRRSKDCPQCGRVEDWNYIILTNTMCTYIYIYIHSIHVICIMLLSLAF